MSQRDHPPPVLQREPCNPVLYTYITLLWLSQLQVSQKALHFLPLFRIMTIDLVNGVCYDFVEFFE
jgi:hypothetical protein